VLGLGALLVLDNKITPGMMIAASILVGRTLAPVQQVIADLEELGSTRSAYERLNGLLEKNPRARRAWNCPCRTG
jgi:ATP-binding cassette subfamily C exporter for protease/lipase